MISKPLFIGLGLAILGVSLYNAYVLTRFAQAGQKAGADVEGILSGVRRIVGA